MSGGGLRQLRQEPLSKPLAEVPTSLTNSGSAVRSGNARAHVAVTLQERPRARGHAFSRALAKQLPLAADNGKGLR
jgi:hypothetical protein